MLVLLATAAGAPQLRGNAPKLHASRPAYNNTVLPENDTFHQQFAMVVNPNYGLHVFATGANGSIFHQYQTSFTAEPDGGMPMSGWHCLTPDNGTASDGFHPLVFWEDPVAALNHDGRAEIFIRLTGDLDLWQLYQTDAKDPLAWVKPRGPVCLCNFPPCKDKGQSKCGLEASCDNKGVDCDTANPDDYWSDHSGFPTSNMNTHVDPKTGQISMYYRGFDGHMYRDIQAIPGNSSKYTSGKVWLFDGIFE